jgi:hypothetical protein
VSSVLASNAVFFCACVFSFIPHFKEICIFSTYFFSSLGGPFRKKRRKRFSLDVILAVEISRN